MDMFKAMNAVQNPQAQQMFVGKTKSEQLKTLCKLYRERGMDLDTVAKQYGAQI